jgi:hypothetical protein
MATRNKITLSPAIDHAVASAFVRFTLGDVERYAADAWRDAIEGEADKAKEFYHTVIKAHDIVPASLRKPDGRARTNEEGAAYDFTQAVYYRLVLGAEVGDAMADAKVAKDVILHPPGKKAQTKGQLRQSYGGGKAWGAFLTRLEALHDAEQGVEEPAKKKAVKNIDRKFMADQIMKAVNRGKLPVEKQDGSVEPDTMVKAAAYFADGLKMFGLK